MTSKMKRVLYALVLGAIFAFFTSITDAETPPANLRGQIQQSRSASQTTTVHNPPSLHVKRTSNAQPHQPLFVQQQFLLQQPAFSFTPDRRLGTSTQPFLADQFVPFIGSGQTGFGQTGFGQTRDTSSAPLRSNRIHFGN